MSSKINLRPVLPQGPFDGSPMQYNGVTPITATLPQVAQLDIKYAGPLVKNSVVEKFEDLTNPDIINVVLNYQHRRIWVKEYACEYYLDNGDGSRPDNWKRAIGRLVVNTWSPTENYQAGDIVNYFGKLYFAKVNITRKGTERLDSNGNVVLDQYGNIVYDYEEGPSPLNHEDIWEVVTGEIETYTWHFDNSNQVQIYTEIRNPRFEICLGEKWVDENGNQIINPETNLPEYKNIEIVEACIIRGYINPETGEITQEPLHDDLGDSTEDSNFLKGGVPYIIQLFTDEVLTEDKTYYDTERINEDKSVRTKFNLIVTVK